MKKNHSQHVNCFCCEGLHRVSVIVEKEGKGVDVQLEIQNFIDGLPDGKNVRITIES